MAVTASEGESLEKVMRYRHTVLLWSLNEEAYRELLQELKPPPNLRFEAFGASSRGTQRSSSSWRTYTTGGSKQ